MQNTIVIDTSVICIQKTETFAISNCIYQFEIFYSFHIGKIRILTTEILLKKFYPNLLLNIWSIKCDTSKTSSDKKFENQHMFFSKKLFGQRDNSLILLFFKKVSFYIDHPPEISVTRFHFVKSKFTESQSQFTY